MVMVIVIPHTPQGKNTNADPKKMSTLGRGMLRYLQ
jgi:hypothetical protein